MEPPARGFLVGIVASLNQGRRDIEVAAGSLPDFDTGSPYSPDDRENTQSACRKSSRYILPGGI